MATFQLSSLGLSSSSSSSSSFNHITNKTLKLSKQTLSFCRGKKENIIRALSTNNVPADSGSEAAAEPEKKPSVNLVFVAPVMLPDLTPDLQCRTACEGENLRRLMLDANIELYGPYGRVLLNCAGGGLCGTCVVEVIEGRELLSPRTAKEKEKLEKKPKNWRLACQTTVGKPDMEGVVVVQQMPEWKGHSWTYEMVESSDIDKFLEDNTQPL